MARRPVPVEFSVWVRVECKGCGERHDLDAAALPDSHRCGTCEAKVVVPPAPLVLAQITNEQAARRKVKGPSRG
jgi:hypothetical protein